MAHLTVTFAPTDRIPGVKPGQPRFIGYAADQRVAKHLMRLDVEKAVVPLFEDADLRRAPDASGHLIVVEEPEGQPDTPEMGRYYAVVDDFEVYGHYTAEPAIPMATDPVTLGEALDAFNEVLAWCSDIEDDGSRLPLDTRERAVKALNAATMRFQPERVDAGKLPENVLADDPFAPIVALLKPHVTDDDGCVLFFSDLPGAVFLEIDQQLRPAYEHRDFDGAPEWSWLGEYRARRFPKLTFHGEWHYGLKKPFLHIIGFAVPLEGLSAKEVVALAGEGAPATVKHQDVNGADWVVVDF